MKKKAIRRMMAMMLSVIFMLSSILTFDVWNVKAEDNPYMSVFDAQYYAQHNEDVADAVGNDVNALFWHFIYYGMAEGRQGSSEFNVQTYMNNYDDLRTAFGGELRSYYEHYVFFGKAEGRTGADNIGMPDIGKYSSVFSAEFYYNNNSDVAEVFGNDAGKLFDHFLNYGMAEGRRGSDEFDVNYYMNSNQDLKDEFGGNLKAYYEHYIYFGRIEGRNGAAKDDSSAQIEAYRSVFNAGFYFSHYEDVAAAFGNNEQALFGHFLNYGMAEGRQGNAEFDVNMYMDNYSDLKEAFGGDLKSYYEHYINYGKAEGRTGRIENNDPHEHSYSWIVTNEATIYQPGLKQYKCTVCGDVKESQEIPKISHNHSWNEGSVTKAATCTAEGTKIFTCGICKETKTEAIAKNGHKYNWVTVKEATTTETGLRQNKCTVCGDVAQEETIPVLPNTDEFSIEGIEDFSDVLNVQYYYSHNADVKEASGGYVSKIKEHFINYGMKEGRQGNAEFNVFVYKNNYPDLEALFGNDLVKYYVHYIKYGKAEGRTADKYSRCRLPMSNQYAKYEYAYVYNDTSKLSGDTELAFYNSFKAYLDYAYQYNTQYEQEKAIHDYMILHSQYDKVNYDKQMNGTGTIPGTSYEADGIILKGTAVCDGYRKAFKLFMDVLGIECIGVTGTADGGAHAWNQVKLDGEWYVVDVTWDDPLPDTPGRVMYDYFNVTTEQINKNHVADSNPPAATGTRYNYLNMLAAAGKITVVDSDMPYSEYNRLLNSEWVTHINEDGKVIVRINVKSGEDSNAVASRFVTNTSQDITKYERGFSHRVLSSYVEFVYTPLK